MADLLPGEARAQFARQALAGALERGEPIGLGPEAAQAMREALRDVWALHAPEPGQHPGFCGADLRELPCPTLRAIKGEPR